MYEVMPVFEVLERTPTIMRLALRKRTQRKEAVVLRITFGLEPTVAKSQIYSRVPAAAASLLPSGWKLRLMTCRSAA